MKNLSYFSNRVILVLGNDNDAFTSQGYKFRIKIRQLDCTSNKEEIQRLRAPESCLQYFIERQGTVSSFNWDPMVTPQRQYVPDQSYFICFRKTASDCRLALERSKAAPDFSTSVGRVPDGCMYDKPLVFPSFKHSKLERFLHRNLPYLRYFAMSSLTLTYSSHIRPCRPGQKWSYQNVSALN